MAKLTGLIKLEGTIEDLTFYRTSDGYIARKNLPISADRIATDPAFIRTRENMAEFSRAGKGSKLMREAFYVQLKAASDKRTTSRLTRELMRVIKADAVNGRGLRNLVDGEKTLLEGFEFNATAKLGTTFFAPYATAINRVSGEVTVTVPAFVPVNSVVAPAGATHFRINSAVASFDFETESYEVDSASSATLAWDGTATAPLTLTSNLTAASTGAILLVLGIEFFQEVNGTNYSLSNGAFNALTIVAVDQL